MKIAEIRNVRLDHIDASERLRAVEEDHALAIQASIVEHGLINPITVRATPPNKKNRKPFTLVAGAHRLRAIELLGEDEIAAVVVAADHQEAQLVEISENLIRNELSALDRALLVMGYRRIWEESFGPIGRGRPQNRVNITQLLEDEAQAGFSQHVAKRLGCSAETIKLAAFIAKNLIVPLQRALVGTATADNQAQLIRLAKLPPAKQHDLVRALKITDGDLEKALEAIDDNAAARQKLRPGEKRIATVFANFRSLGAADRKAALAKIAHAYPRGAVELVETALSDDDQLAVYESLRAKFEGGAL